MGSAAAPVGQALQGFGSITQGYNEQVVYNAESREQKRAAIAGRTAADQTDVYLREELARTQANIDVIRGAAGVVPLSPTGMALKDEASRVAARQRVTSVANLNRKAEQSDIDARALTYAGYAAVDAGWLKGLTSFAAAAQSAASMAAGGGGGGAAPAYPVGMPSGGI